ncbi:MAG: methyltransferase domain-containing protein [Planctomycetaceae bacterium]
MPSTPHSGGVQNTECGCCLCHGIDFEIVDTRDRKGDSLVTVMCRDCGLISHRDIPSDEELANFYESEYRLRYHGERAPSNRRVMRAWRNGQRILNQLSPHLFPDSNVLEIGAGLGCTVRNFQEAGHIAEGIDPGRDFTNFAATKLGVNISQRSLTDLQERQERDVVLLIHVIEHLNAPRDAFLRIHQLLKPGGQLYIECPNLDAPVARRSRLFHFAHVYNFTPSTLRMMAEQSGFELVKQFGRKRHPNLQMLFRKTEARSFHVRPTSSQRTLRRIRMGRLRYHLRPSYLIERVRKLTNYAIEHLLADRYVQQLTGKQPQPTTKPVILPLPKPTPGISVRRAA